MIEIFIPGAPAPQGSKMLMGKQMIEASSKVAPWRARVMLFAQSAFPEDWQRNGPMNVVVTFILPRAKGHWSKRGGVLPSAPDHPIGRVGDIDKFCRALLDGLTGVAFNDDSQVVGLGATKRYVWDETEAVGTAVTVSRVDP